MNKETNINQIVNQIVANRGTKVDAVIPILQDIQNEFNYLPQEALKRVCEITEITPSRISGISTFYSQFRHEPAGKHIIKVCTGTACHVKGALLVHDALKRDLKMTEKDHTSADGLFTIEKVACLGCCTIAPVIQIDEVTFGNVIPEKAGEILTEFLANQDKTSSSKLHTIKSPTAKQGEIRIGLGSCCVASGSEEVKAELEKTLNETRINVTVKQVGCVGICNQVPIMEIIKEGEKPSFYAKVKPEEVREILLSHFKPIGLYDRLKTKFLNAFENVLIENMPKSVVRYEVEEENTPVSNFLGPQMSIASENRGVIRPCDIAEYKLYGGFVALQKCLTQMTKQQIVDEILKSGLRGRGGAGFPTARKWQLVKNQTEAEKYVICNGDEGDPGAFMDRMLLESYPFRTIEGMLIAAYATGAQEGIYYIRAEYPLAVKRIKEALQICTNEGLLGEKILGSDFSFKIKVFEGAGAFICGEETALIESIEGNRGLPIMRPPYPVENGLWSKPTLINNVETLSQVSWIIRHGAEAFASIGTPTSKGTKVFALAGKIRHGGLIEVPMGISIKQIVEEIGGGIANGKKFKAVQIGGPSGGCIPASMSDLKIDYEALTGAGAMMGSGGLVVLDETDCMVDIAHYFLSFTQNQSCGRCTFCRIGTRRMLELLDKIRSGKGTQTDLVNLEKLSESTKSGSMCGLGRSAPNPVLSTLKYFRHEYEAHLRGECPAGKCVPLIKYIVNNECIGCTKCAQRCPSDAIAFVPYEKHHINLEKCIKCDICRQVCPVNAIEIQ